MGLSSDYATFGLTAIEIPRLTLGSMGDLQDPIHGGT